MRVRIRTLGWLVVLAIVAFLAVTAVRVLMPDQYRWGEQKLKAFWNAPYLRAYLWPKLSEGPCRLRYDGAVVDARYAKPILTICSRTLDILEEVTGRSLPDSVQVYAFGGPKHYLWTDGRTQLWIVLEGSQDLMPPNQSLPQDPLKPPPRNTVANIAHSMSLFANCIDTGDPSFPANELGTALANYFTLNHVVPGLWKAEGENLWPVRYVYAQGANPTIYKQYAPLGVPTRAANRVWGPADAIWNALDAQYGAEALGEVLRRTCSGKERASLDDWSRAIVEVTKDEALAKQVRRLTPTLPSSPTGATAR